MKQMMKRTLLTFGRPVWKRLSPKFYRRIDKRIDMRLATIETDWKQHVPAFLNAVSSVRAFGLDLAKSRKDLHEEIVELRGTLQRQDDLLRQALKALQGQVELLHETMRAQSRQIHDDGHDELNHVQDELQPTGADAAGQKV